MLEGVVFRNISTIVTLGQFIPLGEVLIIYVYMQYRMNLRKYMNLVKWGSDTLTTEVSCPAKR